MTLLKVARMGHPVLRRRCDPLPEAAIGTEELNSFLEDMVATMHDYAGIGLAAPQVHVPSRVVVVTRPWLEESTEPDEPAVLINPEILEHSDDEVAAWEGCLSIPGIRGEVFRWESIRVRALSPGGESMEFEATGYPARVIQHEVDHLDGILFLDRMEDLKRLAFSEEYARYWHDSEGA